MKYLTCLLSIIYICSIIVAVYAADQDIVSGCPNPQRSTKDFVTLVYNTFPVLRELPFEDDRFLWINMYAELIQSSVYFEYCQVCGQYAEMAYPAATLEMNVMITEAREVCQFGQKIDINSLLTVPTYAFPDITTDAAVTVSFLNYLNVTSLSNYQLLDDCYKQAFLNSAKKRDVWGNIDRQIIWGTAYDLQRYFVDHFMSDHIHDQFLWNLTVWQGYVNKVIPGFKVYKRFKEMISDPVPSPLPPVEVQVKKHVPVLEDTNNNNNTPPPNPANSVVLENNTTPPTTDQQQQQVCHKVFTYQEICSSLQDKSMIHCEYPFIRKCEKRVNNNNSLFYCKCINQKNLYF